jgi:plasmid stabilization system protein ParE
MDFRVEVTAEAKHDIESVLEWLLSEGAGDTGIRWFLALEDAIASLGTFPERCPLAPENGQFPFELRQLLYGGKPHVYRVLFRIQDGLVYVLHIRHGRRRPQPYQ